MNTLPRRLVIACLTCGIVLVGAADVPAQLGIGSGMRIDAPAASMKDLRDRNVIKQRFDFSCGAAALGTLLRYGFGENVTEREILVQLFALLSEEEKTDVRGTGFSLLHLQRVAQARGYVAEGFRLTAEQLPRLGGPVIVFIQPRGYKHFAVLRGVRSGRVHLADPSRGNMRMPAYAFVKDWLQDNNKGIIFVVEPKAGIAPGKMRLTLPPGNLSRPEIMSARELMAVGNPLVQFSGPSR